MILGTHLFCLLNLSTILQLFWPLLLAYTFDVLDLIHQHNQLNTILYLLCVIYYVLYTMHYALYTMHYALCTIHYALFTMHYTLCTMHYLLCTMPYVLCIHIYTYSYIFTILYAFIRIHYFTWKFGEIP